MNLSTDDGGRMRYGALMAELRQFWRCQPLSLLLGLVDDDFEAKPAVSASELCRFGLDLPAEEEVWVGALLVAGQELARLRRWGWTVRDDAGWRITDQGLDALDSVWCRDYDEANRALLKLVERLATCAEAGRFRRPRERRSA